MLRNQTPLLEVVARVACIYFALLVLVRATGKREIGQLGPLELLGMLMLSETVSPGLTGQDTSITASLCAAVTLLVLSAGVARISFRWTALERLIEGEPRVLVERGRLIERVCAEERISRSELDSALRRHGVTSIDDVQLAVVEANGEITVIKRSETGEAS